ncbi:hypothetical protein LZK73_26515 (plasmid) [Neorhizobium galegae]|nr:hypothetical protein LZK73_26515 [Neorhizobium galegae]
MFAFSLRYLEAGLVMVVLGVSAWIGCFPLKGFSGVLASGFGNKLTKIATIPIAPTMIQGLRAEADIDH